MSRITRVRAIVATAAVAALSSAMGIAGPTATGADSLPGSTAPGGAAPGAPTFVLHPPTTVAPDSTVTSPSTTMVDPRPACDALLAALAGQPDATSPLGSLQPGSHFLCALTPPEGVDPAEWAAFIAPPSPAGATTTVATTLAPVDSVPQGDRHHLQFVLHAGAGPAPASCPVGVGETLEARDQLESAAWSVIVHCVTATAAQRTERYTFAIDGQPLEQSAEWVEIIVLDEAVGVAGTTAGPAIDAGTMASSIDRWVAVPIPAVGTPATSVAPNVATTAAPRPPKQPGQNMFEGDHGPGVLGLQKALKLRGYNVPTDGAFGHSTLIAVKKFQNAVGLAADGQVGPRTRAALGIGTHAASGFGDQVAFWHAVNDFLNHPAGGYGLPPDAQTALAGLRAPSGAGWELLDVQTMSGGRVKQIFNRTNGMHVSAVLTYTVRKQGSTFAWDGLWRIERMPPP